MFLIVINHVTQTLGTASEFVNFQDYVIPLGNATDNLNVIALMLLRQAGSIGNLIFFVCSAYFLVGSKGTARKKAFSLLSTVWTISILFLCVYFIECRDCLTLRVVIMQILPNSFANNWYVTCYIIFLFIYPLINKLVSVIEQRQLFRITLFSSTVWIFLNYLKGDLFFPSALILWVTLYFLVTYLKMYCPRFMANTKAGIVLVVAGIVGSIAQVLVCNFVGLHLMGSLADKVLRGNTNCCPFFVMIAIGLLVIAIKGKYRIRAVNYFASLSMLIYLIHENYLFRKFTRPAIWQYIYNNYGYSHIILIDLLFSVVLFLVAAIASCVYRETLHRVETRASSKLYQLIARFYYSIESYFLKI